MTAVSAGNEKGKATPKENVEAYEPLESGSFVYTTDDVLASWKNKRALWYAFFLRSPYPAA